MISVSLNKCEIKENYKTNLGSLQKVFFDSELFQCINKALLFIYRSVNSNAEDYYYDTNIYVELEDCSAHASFNTQFAESFKIPFTKFMYLFPKMRYDLLGRLDLLSSAIKECNDKRQYCTFDLRLYTNKYKISEERLLVWFFENHVYIEDDDAFVVSNADANELIKVLKVGMSTGFKHSHKMTSDRRNQKIEKQIRAYIDKYQNNTILESPFHIKDTYKKTLDLKAFLESGDLYKPAYYVCSLRSLMKSLFYQDGIEIPKEEFLYYRKDRTGNDNYSYAGRRKHNTVKFVNDHYNWGQYSVRCVRKR